MGASPHWMPGYIALDDEIAIAELEKDWCVMLHDLPAPVDDLAERLRRKKVRVAVVLGEDPLGDPAFPADLREGLLAADFLVVGDVFATRTAQAASVVLPLSGIAETSGTVTSLERRVQRVARAIPPLAGAETWQILCGLAAAMGYRFKLKYSNVAEVTDEIRRVVPLYRDVNIGSRDADGIWDRNVFALERVAPDLSKIGAPVEPVPTLGLDALEARFAEWFEGILGEARGRLGKDALVSIS